MPELRRIRNDAAIPLSEILATTGRLQRGWAATAEPMGIECNLELIKQLSEKAAAFLKPDQMDAWLAPRLHAALRIPRRVAMDEGMWTWLAFQSQPFVEARFKKDGRPLHPWRYRGAWSRNALSRLWWGAEMTRNGSDYSAVPFCFARTRTAQFALELMYSWDRAAAIAFTLVSEGADGKGRLSDATMNRLSTTLKILLSVRSLNSFGRGEVESTDEFDSAWASLNPTFAALVQPDVARISGPEFGVVAQSRIEDLSSWFRQIVQDFTDLTVNVKSPDEKTRRGGRIDGEVG